MCYEFKRFDTTRAARKDAEQRTREILDKAKSAKPAPRREQPVMSEKEKETVPV